MRSDRNNMRSANGLVIFLAFLGADDTAGCFFQFSVDQSGANSADMLISDSSLRIDEETFRNAPYAVVHRYLSGFIPAVWIADVELLEKGAGILLCVLEGDAEKRHILVLDLLPSSFEILRLRPARHAPRGPKIQEYCFTTQIVEVDFAAIEKSDSKWCRLLGQQRRGDIARVAGESEGKQPNNRRDQQNSNQQSSPSHFTLFPEKSFPTARLPAGFPRR